MTPDRQAPVRILVVDDEATVQDAYRQIFCEPREDAAAAARRDLGARLFGHAAPAAPRRAASTFTFEATYCSNAGSAVEAVRQALADARPYAVVFLDMRMPPGRDGVWAAARIRELDAAIEIAICTAYSDVDPGDLGGHVPPEDKLSYLQKPFHPHEVRQMAIALASKWRAERNVARLAYFDALTELPNREQSHRRLRAAALAAQQHGRNLAVLYIDLDNFKRINDTLGHAVGDEVLRITAGRLRESLGQEQARNHGSLEHPGDCGRLGGDEFMVLLPHIGSSLEAGQYADRLIEALRKPMAITRHTVVVTPSIGIAVAPTDGSEAEALLRHADLAMYFAKRRWPGTYAFFDASMNEGAQQRYSIEGKLRSALERREFTLHYQPQIELASGAVAGMEALLRWTNEELGVVPPNDFIPVAEEAGLIIPIGEWVLRTACAQVRRWQVEGLAIRRMAVNIASQQFAAPNFAQLVANVLRETQVDAQLLELEVTESMVMKDEGHAMRVLEELHGIGVSIAIDDFGTGYSNFQRLQNLAVDRLKMDRSFVRDLDDDSDNRAIAAAIISMARALDVAVVAEGVETFAQLRFLQENQCAYAQGFLLSRALPATDARLLLQRATAQFDGSRTQRIRQLIE